MDIISSYAYQGKNIYSHNKVIKMQVDLGAYYDTPTNQIDGFNEKLVEILPGLKKHCCSLGYEGGFCERLLEGTYFGHVIEHIAIEIQNMLGYDIKFGKTRQSEKETIYNIVYCYENEEAGMASGKLAVDLVNGLVAGEAFDFNTRFEIIRKIAVETDLGSSTAVIKKEAEKRGIPVMRIGDGSLLQLGYGKNQKRVQATLTGNASCIAVDTACNKNLAKMIMHEYGIPVPTGKIVRSEEEALEYAERIGYPVVVKPNYGSHGDGVSINLKNPQEVLEAYRIVREYEDTVLIEKFIKGSYFRILVIGNEVVAASQRVSAHVVGDGSSTVRELIQKENQNPMRGDGHEKPLTRINIDKVVELYLKKQDLSLDYIPAEKEMVHLRENDNLSTGGIAIDVTDIIHPENKRLAILAARSIGMDVAGIDMTATDITKPINEAGGAIIEINAAPGIRMHHYPAQGTPRNAAKAIVDLLCPEGECFGVPIVSVTGTNGKTTTTRMIAHILKQKGAIVGMTSTSGIYIDGQLIKKGDNTGATSAKAILMDNTVEYAVLETARGGLVKKGLGYDIADVGIITNISEDHLGIDGINTLEDLAHVKCLVAEAVKEDGFAVLNADDDYCVGMKERIKANIIYFSTNPENQTLKSHIENGGIGIYADDETIYIAIDKTGLPLMTLEEIPAALGGILKHNVSNSLAAIAGAIGIGLTFEEIKAGMSTFYCDAESNPGRFNLFDVNGVKVVLDYGHNIEGYKVVMEAVEQMEGGRRIGVIGVPGDRSDSSTYKIGELCGNFFDKVYVKEDRDKRGREVGEIARMLTEGCRSGCIEDSEIVVELSEEKALERAILGAEVGDIVVAFFEEFGPLVDVIERVRVSVGEERLIIA